MQQKIGDCKGECNRKNISINSKGLCPDCQYILTHGKTRKEVYLERKLERQKDKPIKYTSFKRKLQKQPKTYVKKSTGELDMFKKIWEERPHYCTNVNCRKYLGNEMNIQFFSHDKSKGAYPELRNDKKNISILCCDCHYIYEFGDRTKIKIEK